MNPPPVSAVALTARETQIAYWIAEGKTNWEISRILDLSQHTVRNHVHNILQKTLLVNRNAIARRLFADAPKTLSIDRSIYIEGDPKRK